MNESSARRLAEAMNKLVEIENAKLVPAIALCNCPLCGKFAIAKLPPKVRLSQPDDTTHVCHPSLGGCNHGFTNSEER